VAGRRDLRAQFFATLVLEAVVLTSGGKNSAKDRLSFVCGHHYERANIDRLLEHQILVGRFECGIVPEVPPSPSFGVVARRKLF
jgi:hypothetical protein